MIFATISEYFDLIEQVFNSICIKIDNTKDITFTNGEVREKILKDNISLEESHNIMRKDMDYYGSNFKLLTNKR